MLFGEKQIVVIHNSIDNSSKGFLDWLSPHTGASKADNVSDTKWVSCCSVSTGKMNLRVHKGGLLYGIQL